MYEKNKPLPFLPVQSSEGFWCQNTFKNTAEAEMETAIGGCQLASLKGSNVKIHRCLNTSSGEVIENRLEEGQTEMRWDHRTEKRRKELVQINGKTLMGFGRGSNTLHTL